MIEPLIVTAFSFFNTIRVVSYVPQMLRIARDTNGATAVSFLTWTLWACANGSTAAYAGVIIGDRALCLVSSINTLCCAIVICQTAYKRHRWRAARDMSRSWYPRQSHLEMSIARCGRRLPFTGPPPG
jgi:hypothetical protein